MCNCMTEIDADLAQRGTNTRLATVLVLNRELSRMDAFPAIQTEKIDAKNRKKPLACRPSYCPFCGVKYDA